jgi:acyl-homoserine lactone acylase PvdQ
LNPASHFVQNTNTTPFMTSMSASDPNVDDFPSYMVRESDNDRSLNARRILMGQDTFDFVSWEREGLDTTMIAWQSHKASLFAAYDVLVATNANRANELKSVIEVLSEWDGVARLDAIAPTLYVDWFEALPARDMSANSDALVMMETLEQVVARLKADWGTWRVTWGQINRSQRPMVDARGMPQFCDDCESVATPGVPHWSGGSLISGNPRQDGLKKRYMRGGNSYTAIIDFPADRNERIVSKSIHVFGADAALGSPHHMDQAKLLAAKEYKPAWLYLDDVKKNAVKSYHPGQE